MYNLNVVFVLIAIVSVIIAYFTNRRISKDEHNKHEKFCTFSLLFILFFMLMTLSVFVFFRTNETQGSSNQALVLNASHRPMYDIVNPNDDEETTSVKYKVYLKSGGSKTVSSKIVHVNRSKTSYLKTINKQVVFDVFGLKFGGDKYKDYTLYISDK